MKMKLTKHQNKPNRLQLVEAKVPTTTLFKFAFTLSMDRFNLETRAETRKLRHHARLSNDCGVKFQFVFTMIGRSKFMFGIVW